MIAKMATKGANWMRISCGPDAAPAAWANAGEMNKESNSDRPGGSRGP
jgi:hypothetical protein